jgi:AP-2 complex subunit alpha
LHDLIFLSLQEITVVEPAIQQANGVISNPDSLTVPATADLLVDLLGPLAIEAPPGPVDSTQPSSFLAMGSPTGASDPLAVAILGEESTSVQVYMLLIVQICEA